MRTFVFAVFTTLLMLGAVAAQNWTEIPGIATDIAVSEDGSVWIIGSAQRGHLAFRWDEGAWIKAPGSNWLAIAAGEKGTVVAINRDYKIFRWKDNDWLELPGSATDIAAGGDGVVFIIGSEANGRKLYKWNDGSWTEFPGTNYKRVAVGPEGHPLAIGDDNSVYGWSDDAWKKLDGKATDIAVSSDGKIYVIADESRNHSILRWDDGTWTQLPGEDFRSLAVGRSGNVWATKGDAGKVFQLR